MSDCDPSDTLCVLAEAEAAATADADAEAQALQDLFDAGSLGADATDTAAGLSDAGASADAGSDGGLFDTGAAAADASASTAGLFGSDASGEDIGLGDALAVDAADPGAAAMSPFDDAGLADASSLSDVLLQLLDPAAGLDPSQALVQWLLSAAGGFDVSPDELSADDLGSVLQEVSGTGGSTFLDSFSSDGGATFANLSPTKFMSSTFGDDGTRIDVSSIVASAQPASRASTDAAPPPGGQPPPSAAYGAYGDGSKPPITLTAPPPNPPPPSPAVTPPVAQPPPNAPATPPEPSLLDKLRSMYGGVAVPAAPDTPDALAAPTVGQAPDLWSLVKPLFGLGPFPLLPQDPFGSSVGGSFLNQALNDTLSAPFQLQLPNAAQAGVDLGKALTADLQAPDVPGAIFDTLDQRLNPLFPIVLDYKITTGDDQSDDERSKAGGRLIYNLFKTGVGIALGEGAGELAGGGAAAEGPVKAGEAGRFADLDGRGVTGDNLTPHHMPQAARGFTSRADGGALVMEAGEHQQTRTYGGKGLATSRSEIGLSFRDTLERDIADVRSIVGSKYDQGIKDLLEYYQTNHPELLN